MTIPTFAEFCIDNAEKFKITLGFSAVGEETKSEIIAFINSWPTNDFYWDIRESCDEGVERWGDDFRTVVGELTNE